MAMLELVADWMLPVWFVAMLWLIGGGRRSRRSTN